MEENIYEISNAQFINLPSDIKNIEKKVRESFYYLNGLKELDFYYKTLSVDNKQKLTTGYELFNAELNKIEADLKLEETKDGLLRFSDFDKLKELVRKLLLLHEEVDKFQVEILDELISISFTALTTLTNKKGHLSQISAQISASYFIRSAFLQPHSESSSKHYFLLIEENQKIDKTLNPFEHYFTVSVTDSSFVLYKKRNLVQYFFEEFTNLLFSVSEIENKINLDSMVKKQYSLNKQVVILTYLMGILTIITTVVAIMQLFVH